MRRTESDTYLLESFPSGTYPEAYLYRKVVQSLGGQTLPDSWNLSQVTKRSIKISSSRERI